MRPLLTPGRGSGTSPRNRSAGRASTTCAEPSASAARTSSSEATNLSSRRGVKTRGLGCASPVSSRPAFLDPSRQAAVENAHVLDAVSAQRPPDPRRGIEAERVIDDEAHAVAEAERGHRLGERVRFRQHVRQVLIVVGDQVDVEEHGVRNVLLPELGRAGASGIGQMPGRVDHAEIGVAELGREFSRGAGSCERAWDFDPFI